MVFIETRVYSQTIDSLLDDEEQRDLLTLLRQEPEKGDLLRGTGGVRKLRFAQQSKNKGKRSGVRIISSTCQKPCICCWPIPQKGRFEPGGEEGS
jgi:hypothetical protein